LARSDRSIVVLQAVDAQHQIALTLSGTGNTLLDQAAAEIGTNESVLGRLWRSRKTSASTRGSRPKALSLRGRRA
jgi:hypothetical protein